MPNGPRCALPVNLLAVRGVVEHGDRASGRLSRAGGQLPERGRGGRAGRGAVGDQALAGVGNVQDLALELQRAEPGVISRLGPATGGGDSPATRNR